MGNPDLQPERSSGGEFTGKYAAEILGATAELAGTYFYTNVQHAILWLPSAGGGGAWRPINIGIAESKGWEFKGTASFALTPRATIDLEENYTLLMTTNLTEGDPNHGKEIIYSTPARSVFIVSAVRPEWGTLTISVISRHKFTDPANSREGMLSPVSIYNATVSTDNIQVAGTVLQLGIAVQNLTDEQYSEVIDYPLPGRAFKFSIQLKYH